tara:strand:- start:901 stop:1209 length:309 start_codon:yes stop_codon:yes gene_type:complete
MIQELKYYDFENWFFTNRPNQFTYAGLRALYDYFEHYEEETMEKILFDPIAFCCEYTEYENLKEFKEEYSSAEYKDIKDYKKLDYYTTIIPIDDEAFIIKQF